jgi:hypothetical protein
MELNFSTVIETEGSNNNTYVSRFEASGFFDKLQKTTLENEKG